MSVDKPTKRLSIEEQRIVLGILRKHMDQAPLKEKIFLSHGDILAGVTASLVSFYFWRVGFKAFNMYRYNRGRLITLFYSTFMGGVAAITHTLRNSSKPFGLYRSEESWVYGFDSVLTHELSMISCFGLGIGHTFLNAQLNGFIPVRYDFLHRSKRLETLKFVYSALKPYSRGMLSVVLQTSAAMYAVGYLEYKQSCNLLAKQNRKTVSYEEN